MSKRIINKVAVLGSGVMGREIAYVGALGGYSIVLSCRKVQGYAQNPVY